MIVKVSGLIINLVLGYWLFISPVAAQTVYYVATTGNDSDPGSESQPWRTIQKAANTMVAGDMVTVMAGSFPERINITRSGSSELPITFQAQGTAITKGFKITASYITVKGFEIANTDYVRWDSGTSAGVYIHGAFNTIEHNYIHDATLGGLKLHGPPQDPTTTHHNSILNNRLYHNEMVGIDVNGRDNLIEGNEVWGTVQCHPALVAIEGPGCPNYSAVNGLDADGMRFFGQGNTFKKNNIHDIRISPPESVNPHIDCFQTWAGTNDELAQDILFEQNYCENLNQSMHAFMLAGGTN